MRMPGPSWIENRWTSNAIPEISSSDIYPNPGLSSGGAQLRQGMTLVFVRGFPAKCLPGWPYANADRVRAQGVGL